MMRSSLAVLLLSGLLGCGGTYGYAAATRPGDADADGVPDVLVGATARTRS